MWGEWSASSGPLNAASADELHDHYDYSDDEQEVNESSSDMHCETTEPHDHENHDDDPEQIAHCENPFAAQQCYSRARGLFHFFDRALRCRSAMVTGRTFGRSGGITIQKIQSGMQPNDSFPK